MSRSYVDYIVTYDKNVLALKMFREIPIITPDEFFNIIRSNQNFENASSEDL